MSRCYEQANQIAPLRAGDMLRTNQDESFVARGTNQPIAPRHFPICRTMQTEIYTIVLAYTSPIAQQEERSSTT